MSDTDETSAIADTIIAPAVAPVAAVREREEADLAAAFGEGAPDAGEPVSTEPARPQARRRRQRRGTRSIVEHHAQRVDIEAALARGGSLRTLGKRFGISISALHRHRKKMRSDAPEVFSALAAADWKVKPEQLEALRLETSDGWLKQLRAQFDKLVRAQDICLQDGNFTVAAQVAAQCHKALQMLGQAVGEIATHSVRVENNVVLMPSYLTLRSELLRALRPFPEAAQAVVTAFRKVEDAGFTPAASGVRVIEGQAREVSNAGA